MRVARIAVVLPIVLFVVGATLDLMGGLELWKKAGSTSGWAIGVMGLGLLYLFGEAGAGWIDSHDRECHPLWKRLAHLGMLIGFSGVCVIFLWLVWSATT